MSPGPHRVDDVFTHGEQVGRHRLELDLARFELREVEHLVEQRQQRSVE